MCIYMYMPFPGLPLMSFPWQLQCSMIVFWFLILNYYFLMYCVAFDEMGFYHIYISIYTRTFCVTFLSWDLM